MNFVGRPIIAEEALFTLEVEGSEFFTEPWCASINGAHLMKTRFFVKKQIIDHYLEYPSHQTKNRYREQYGPYSVDMFAKKLNELYKSFHDAEIMRDPQRMFVRKMWLFKKIFETCEDSMELILVRISKMIPGIYGKAVNALENAEATLETCDARAAKHVEISLLVIRRIRQKMVEIMVQRPQFLKLLSPPLLEKFIGDASPYMVANIRCLPWIDPELALIAEPKYNLYWTLSWQPFFLKYFKLSSEICYEIAEYMPVKLRGETFLDYFQKKYDAKKGRFRGERAFEIEKSIIFENNCYWNNITIVLCD
jgi:hypothetical protein